MATDTNVRQLVLNKMTKAQYDALETKSPTELYLVTGDSSEANDGKLTIKRNNTKVGEFTANQATDSEVNITVPTTANDVNALPNTTKYAASLSLSINQTTYVVTAQLKDQDGNNLGTAGTIDLPLESVVVSGEYDSVNKKIVLTLQDGSTIDIPVADLVAGLQSEITSTNKLDADLVDDSTSAHKFVTSAEKTKISNAATTSDLDTALATKEDKITAGTTSQYYRGDKTWKTLNKSAVGLGNVDNTSDATKKTNFTGSISSGNTGFTTGGDVYTALSNKIEYAAVFRQH
jgi:hypothetical protein